MKLVTYSQGAGEGRPGILTGERVADTRAAAVLAGLPEERVVALASNRDVVALEAAELAQLERAAIEHEAELHDGGDLHELSAARLGPPIPNPEKIVCLGLNYRDHAAEAGLEPPSAPMFFCKFANSLVGPEDPVVPPRTTSQVDYEAELAVVIGSPAHEVSAARALDHVAGAMALNDFSARDLQLANPLWSGGKTIDTFAPCGPALVTLDSLDGLDTLGIRTRVNGETVQDSNTGSMIFGVAETIAFLSQIMTLVPGDVIATGTPAGVGMSRTPPLWLGEGDEVEVEIDGIGRLGNRVAAPR